MPTVPIYGQEDTPVVFPVHRIYCVGRNYAEHAKEMGGDPDREPPFFFLKPADAIVPCGVATTSGGSSDASPSSSPPPVASIPYPSVTANLHFEVELVVALSSANTIYGFAVGVDLTRRDLQTSAKILSRPWCSAKAFDRSALISAIRPLVSLSIDNGNAAAATAPVPDGTLWLRVNGVKQQEATPARDMIWPVSEILTELGKQFELKGGDLIYTGTPAGVGPLVVGDTVTAGLDGVGELSFTIV
jgi:fumarylpyruvate hydrolase